MDFADHIFVATDFSEASEAAIDAAVVLAQQLGAKITLFHVFDPDPLVPPGAIPNPEQFRDKIEKEMRTAVTERLEELRNEKISGVQPVDVVVATDRSTANAITEHAKNLGADLIIVSTHGRTGLAHLLIGSVAEKVVRHAHCPVLAVRPVER
jgi:nucleotide-binding universal stress UspA family protein